MARPKKVKQSDVPTVKKFVTVNVPGFNDGTPLRIGSGRHGEDYGAAGYYADRETKTGIRLSAFIPLNASQVAEHVGIVEIPVPQLDQRPVFTPESEDTRY